MRKRAPRTCARCGVRYPAGAYKTHAEDPVHKAVTEETRRETLGAQWDLLRQYRNSRMSYTDIGRLLGVSRQRVHAMMKEAGLAGRLPPNNVAHCLICDEWYGDWPTHSVALTHIDKQRSFIEYFSKLKVTK